MMAPEESQYLESFHVMPPIIKCTSTKVIYISLQRKLSLFVSYTALHIVAPLSFVMKITKMSDSVIGLGTPLLLCASPVGGVIKRKPEKGCQMTS